MNLRAVAATTLVTLALSLMPSAAVAAASDLAEVTVQAVTSAPGSAAVAGGPRRTGDALDILAAAGAPTTAAPDEPVTTHDHTDPGDHADGHSHDPGTLIPPIRPGDPFIHVDEVRPADGPFSGDQSAKALIRATGAGPTTGSGPMLAADGAIPAGESDAPGLTQHVAPSCTGTGTDGNRVQVFYAHEAGTPNRFDAVLPVLLNQVANIDDTFAVSSRQTDGGRRVRWVQTPTCAPDIRALTLPAGSLGASPSATFNALNAAGYNAGNRKYLLFADTSTMLYNGAACGVGQFYVDSSPTGNFNDGGYALQARVDCWTGRTAAHELMHMLGAVNSDAPHATASGHCTDASEIMCYSDSTGTVTQTCPTENALYFDCNNDDYFNTSPPGGTYLDTHWNTARSSFLDNVPVLDPAPVVTLAPSQTTVESGDRVTFTATADREVTYQWRVDGFLGNFCDTATPSHGVFTVACPALGDQDLRIVATATDTDGQYDEATAEVALIEAAAPTYALSVPDTIVAGQEVTLTAKATGKNLTYLWEKGDARCQSWLAQPDASALTVLCPEAVAGSRVWLGGSVVQSDDQEAAAGKAVYVLSATPQPPTGPTGTTPPPLPSPVATATTITAGPGHPARLTGALVNAATGGNVTVAGLPVAVSVHWAGTRGWATVAQIHTDSNGNLAYAPPVTTRAGTFRFLFAGNATYAAASRLGEALVKVPVTVGAKAKTGRSTVLIAKAATVSGARLAGLKLVLQRQTEGSTGWAKVAAAVTNGKGVVAVREARARKKTAYRWVLAESAQRAGAISQVVKVRP